MKRTVTDHDAPTTVFIHSQQDVPHWCDEDTYNIVRFESLPTTMNVRRHGDLMIDAKGRLKRFCCTPLRAFPYKFPTAKKRVGQSLECVVPQIVESNRVVLDNVEYRPIGLDVSNTWASKDCHPQGRTTNGDALGRVSNTFAHRASQIEQKCVCDYWMGNELRFKQSKPRALLGASHHQSA